jgi:hypothetical protein
MRTLGIKTREDPLDPGAETAVEQQHGRTRAARNREGFIAGLHAAGRFTGLFFGGSLTPLALDPADAIALWRSMGRFPLLRIARDARLLGPGMPDLTRLDGRITLLWGGRDIWVPRWMRDRWQRALPAGPVKAVARPCAPRSTPSSTPRRSRAPEHLARLHERARPDRRAGRPRPQARRRRRHRDRHVWPRRARNIRITLGKAA